MDNKGKPVQFISMESEKFWYEQIIKVFPGDLKKYVQFEYSERKESRYNGILGSHYANIPKMKFDFMFIDGPGLRKVFNDKSYPKCFNSDLINIVLGSKNLSIDGYIDQRIDTMWKLKKLISKRNFRYLVFKKLTIFKGITQNQIVKGLKIEHSSTAT